MDFVLMSHWAFPTGSFSGVDRLPGTHMCAWGRWADWWCLVGRQVDDLQACMKVLLITWFFKFHFIAGSTFMEILLINKFSQLFLSCRAESKRRKVLWFQNFCHRNLREKSRTLFFILHKGIHWFMCFPIFLAKLLSCFFTHRFKKRVK